MSSPHDEVKIDASPWRYVLFQYPDKLFDIVLEQNNLPEASEDDRYRAAVLALDGMLGEEKRLRWFLEVEPVFALNGQQAMKASPIAVLSKHLDSLV